MNGITSSLSSDDAQQVSFRTHHVLSTAALCLCTLSHGYLLVNVFPYAGYMAISLVPTLTEESAGYYAGMIGSAFMMGRAASSYPFGTLADRYGRKFVLLLSLILCGLWSLLFGLSRSLWQALLFRLLLGISNCIVSTVKTCVSELSNNNDGREKRMMGLAVGTRSFAFLLSPALGGWLAEPLQQYPDSALFSSFASVLRPFPFLLPNLLGTALCVASAVAVFFFIEETLPESERRSLKYTPRDSIEYMKGLMILWRRPTPESKLVSDSDGNRYGAIDSDIDEETLMRPTAISIWSNSNTRQHLISYWGFSFLIACLDEAFPLFTISKHGGLSMSEASIGKILSGAGLLFVALQYIVYASMVDKAGLYPTITLGTLLGTMPLFLIPISLVLQRREPATVSWTTFLFLSGILGMSKIFSCAYFTAVSIALNRTVQRYERGTMNGLATLGGSISKGSASLFAGVLVAFCLSDWIVPTEYGSIVIFSFLGLLGALLTMHTTRLRPSSSGNDLSRSGVLI